jgi:hypothetical protein
MTRNENQMYSDITSIRESLEKIANALDTPNVVYNGELKNTKDIPGFEGTLDALDVLTDIKTITDEYASNKEEDDTVHNDYLNNLIQDMNHTEYLNFHHDMDFGFASSDAAALTNHIYDLEYEEVLDCIKSALLITGDSDYVKAVECSEFDMERKDELAREYVIDLVKKENTTNDPYTYDNDLNEYVDGIKNDSDHDIRTTAKFYEDEYLYKEGATKKECILDYVTNEFGLHGARYTDVIKFCYYLGAHNAPKYDATRDRGYYSCAFATRFGGHLVQGGKNQLVKGINKEGKERYFALSEVDNFTAYYKRIA